MRTVNSHHRKESNVDWGNRPTDKCDALDRDVIDYQISYLAGDILQAYQGFPMSEFQDRMFETALQAAADGAVYDDVGERIFNASASEAMQDPNVRQQACELVARSFCVLVGAIEAKEA